MENILKFIKKYKMHILITLLVIFFFKSCSKSSKIGLLESDIIKYEDSLKIVKESSYKHGFIKGMDTEKSNISNYIDLILRGPQNVNVRNFQKELQDSLDVNKHRP